MCGLGVFQETLAKRSFDTSAQKHGEFRCCQASTLTPKCVCSSGKPNSLPAPSYFSVRLAPGDDAFPTQMPRASTNRSLRFITGAGRVCGNQHQAQCVLVKVKVSYLTSVAKQAKTAFLHGPTDVCYRKRVMPYMYTAKCLQLVLTDTSCP